MRTIINQHIKGNEQKAIQLASETLREKFPVQKVILFGSKARGDDDEESDIDLLLLTDRPVSWEERKAISDSLYDIEMSHNVILSSLISTETEWNEGTFSVMPIHDEVEEQGIVI